MYAETYEIFGSFGTCRPDRRLLLYIIQESTHSLCIGIYDSSNQLYFIADQLNTLDITQGWSRIANQGIISGFFTWFAISIGDANPKTLYEYDIKPNTEIRVPMKTFGDNIFPERQILVND